MAYCNKIGAISLLALVVALGYAAPIVSVNTIQVDSVDTGTTEVKLVFTDNPTIHYFILKNPSRLVVDIAHGHLEKPIPTQQFHGTLIKGFRQGTQPHQTLRLVFHTIDDVSIRKSTVAPKTVVFMFKSKRLPPLARSDSSPTAESAVPPLTKNVKMEPGTQNNHNGVWPSVQDSALPTIANGASKMAADTSGSSKGLSTSIQQDSLLLVVGQLKSFFSLNEDQAVALELDGGPRVIRANGTYGFALNDTNRVKLTAEYLQENLDFDFYTGDTRQWVNQGAIGASYQYLFDNNTFKDLEIGSHYSHAPSKDLGDQTVVYADGSTVTDYRRIAGGDDWNGTAETALHLWAKGLLTVGGDYDRVRYDTKYYIQNGHDTQGFGGHARLQQLLTPSAELEAQSTVSELFNSYGVSLNWIWTSMAQTVLSAGLNSSYTQDRTTERNFWINGINLNVSWDQPKSKEEKPRYTESQIAHQNLATWVQTPAVRMPDVLAISDEYVVTSKPFTPITGICPLDANVQYDSATQTYSAAGGWFQSYPQGPAGPAVVVAFDSANIMGNPSGQTACLYILNGTKSRPVILENNTFKNATDVGTSWIANGTSKFWPSTEPTPSFTCPAVPKECQFQTTA